MISYCQSQDPRLSQALGIPAAAFERLSALRVMVAGQGNIGTFLSLQLAPLVASLRIVDRDDVEPHNAINQMYRPCAAGRAKVDVMAEQLVAHAPRLEVHPLAVDLEDLPWDDYADIDVCLAAVDSLSARQIVSEHTYALQIPYIDGAVGEPLLGRIQVLVPGAACLECDWSARHYQQLSTEYPCQPAGSATGPPTQAPRCAGAVVAGIMVAQLIRLCAEAPPNYSYEITGDLLAGRFLASRRRRNVACRFHHQSRPLEFALDVPLETSTTGDLVRLLNDRYGSTAWQLETRRNIFPSELFASQRHVGLKTLADWPNVRLTSLGLTERDRFVVHLADSQRTEHLRLGPTETLR